MTQRKRKFRRTRWFKKWVWVKLDSEEHPTHCLCLGMSEEGDSWFFQFQYENGDVEHVASTSVARIRTSKAALTLAESTVVSLNRPHGGGDGTGTPIG